MRPNLKVSRVTWISYLSELLYRALSCLSFTAIFSLKISLIFLSIFISLDFESEFPAAVKELTIRLRNGSLKRKFHIVEGGIEQAPVALPMLFNGGNTGKLWVLENLSGSVNNGGWLGLSKSRTNQKLWEKQSCNISISVQNHLDYNICYAAKWPKEIFWPVRT